MRFYKESWCALSLVLLALTLAFAPGQAKAGPRADHWSGFDLGLGVPFPTIYGLSIGFNINDDARLSSGLGSFVHWSTYNIIDAKVFLGKESEWAGYFGAGLDYMTGTAQEFLGYDLQFNNAFIPYFEGGVDFQSVIGIHVMFNVAGSAPNGSVMVLPGLAIGWYF